MLSKTFLPRVVPITETVIAITTIHNNGQSSEAEAAKKPKNITGLPSGTTEYTKRVSDTDSSDEWMEKSSQKSKKRSHSKVKKKKNKDKKDKKKKSHKTDGHRHSKPPKKEKLKSKKKRSKHRRHTSSESSTSTSPYGKSSTESPS
jgi:hypothetical protein